MFIFQYYFPKFLLYFLQHTLFPICYFTIHKCCNIHNITISPPDPTPSMPHLPRLLGIYPSNHKKQPLQAIFK